MIHLSTVQPADIAARAAKVPSDEFLKIQRAIEELLEEGVREQERRLITLWNRSPLTALYFRQHPVEAKRVHDVAVRVLRVAQPFDAATNDQELLEKLVEFVEALCPELMEPTKSLFQMRVPTTEFERSCLRSPVDRLLQLARRAKVDPRRALTHELRHLLRYCKPFIGQLKPFMQSPLYETILNFPAVGRLEFAVQLKSVALRVQFTVTLLRTLNEHFGAFKGAKRELGELIRLLHSIEKLTTYLHQYLPNQPYTSSVDIRFIHGSKDEQITGLIQLCRHAPSTAAKLFQTKPRLKEAFTKIATTILQEYPFLLFSLSIPFRSDRHVNMETTLRNAETFIGWFAPEVRTLFKRCLEVDHCINRINQVQKKLRLRISPQKRHPTSCREENTQQQIAALKLRMNLIGWNMELQHSKLRVFREFQKHRSYTKLVGLLVPHLSLVPTSGAATCREILQEALLLQEEVRAYLSVVDLPGPLPEELQDQIHSLKWVLDTIQEGIEYSEGVIEQFEAL